MSADLALVEPWESEARQVVAARFGVWTFLATETLFFGALLLVYARARWAHPGGFEAGARETEVLLGSINTVLLLTSSLTMTIAERALREKMVALARAMLLATIVLGAAFLAVKGYEYHGDIEKHLVPGSDFPLSTTGASEFWGFYWTGTAIHAAHLTIGLGLIVKVLLIPRRQLAGRWTVVEGTGLYWHLVDIVWMILFPLIYLVGR